MLISAVRQTVSSWEAESVETTPDVGHDADEELHHPRGTLLIMGLYLLSMVATWAWVFLVLEGRT